MIVKFAKWIGSKQSQLFTWLAKKSETNPLWACVLTIWALWEICEKITTPLMAFLYFTNHLFFN
jgi:hypothetical protein